MNWLERARHEFCGIAATPTANTAERDPTAATAVSTAAMPAENPPSVGSNGSAPFPRIAESGAVRGEAPAQTTGSACGLDRRRAKVERELQANPSLHVAVDVANAPPRPEPGPPVSLVLALRTAAGIVSAEFLVPRERWDPVLLLETLRQTAGRPS
jgi:hypothetical protein